MEIKFRTLKADEIDCRIAQISKTGSGMFLLYKDARVDMSLLDEVVGPMNWQREHTRDNANCIVSIWDDEKKLWISKEDTGTESNTEKEKGLASDSFKRACFNWGIGRELYTAPTIWVKPLTGEEIKFLKLHCSKIGYNENREITTLELTDEKGNVRYKFWNKKTEDQQQMTDEQKMMREVAMKDVESAKSVDGLEDVWKSNILLHTDNEFKNAVIKKKAELL
jgi:hypothetical protein